MQRRPLILAAALASVLPAAPSWAANDGAVDYTRAAYENALNSGEAFLLDFYAPW